MPSISDTAYPRLKTSLSAKELEEIYTPSLHELSFAKERTRQAHHCAYLLILLKTFQRLGYFATFTGIPELIIDHIAKCVSLTDVSEQLRVFDTTTIRDRHKPLIREFVGVRPFGKEARQIIISAALLRNSPYKQLNLTASINPYLNSFKSLLISTCL